MSKRTNDDNDDDAVVTCLAALIIAVVFGGLYLAITSSLLLWAWNLALVPLLHLPSLNYSMALALMVMVSLVGIAFRSSKGARND